MKVNGDVKMHRQPSKVLFRDGMNASMLGITPSSLLWTFYFKGLKFEFRIHKSETSKSWKFKN